MIVLKTGSLQCFSKNSTVFDKRIPKLLTAYNAIYFTEIKHKIEVFFKSHMWLLYSATIVLELAPYSSVLKIILFKM